MNQLKLNPHEQTFGADSKDISPILKALPVDKIKQIEQLRPQLICILTTDGVLYLIHT